jgi:NAD+ synthase (glutamine-hydrolysing)
MPLTRGTHPATRDRSSKYLLPDLPQGMQDNSSPNTRSRSKNLAMAIGSYHLDLNIDGPYKAIVSLFSSVTSYVPMHKVYGGTNASNLALQNIQARLRMVLSYLFAQLLPTVRGRNADNPENSSPGGLLVLGSANVDESLVSTFLFFLGGFQNF